MIINQNITVPDMKSLTSCLNKMIADGYTDDFKAVDEGLKAIKSEKIYSPDDVTIVNYYRFEGQSDPDDMSILYVIQTVDGTKGTLVDAYGPYADENVNKFVLEVEKIQKKVVTKSQG